MPSFDFPERAATCWKNATIYLNISATETLLILTDELGEVMSPAALRSYSSLALVQAGIC